MKKLLNLLSITAFAVLLSGSVVLLTDNSSTGYHFQTADNIAEVIADKPNKSINVSGGEKPLAGNGIIKRAANSSIPTNDIAVETTTEGKDAVLIFALSDAEYTKLTADSAKVTVYYGYSSDGTEVNAEDIVSKGASIDVDISKGGRIRLIFRGRNAYEYKDRLYQAVLQVTSADGNEILLSSPVRFNYSDNNPVSVSTGRQYVEIGGTRPYYGLTSVSGKEFKVSGLKLGDEAITGDDLYTYNESDKSIVLSSNLISQLGVGEKELYAVTDSGDVSLPLTIADKLVYHASDLDGLLENDPVALTKYYVLMDDIDVYDYSRSKQVVSGNNTYDSWNPIGTYDGDTGTGTAFTGTFDGNGHELSNLHMFIETGGNSYNAGVFRYNKGTIKNLGISGDTYDDGVRKIWALAWSGAFVGVNEGTIDNCYVNASFRAESNNNGGFVCTNSGTITNSFMLGNCVAAAGGLGAFARSNLGTIKNCFAYKTAENGDLGSVDSFIYDESEKAVSEDNILFDDLSSLEAYDYSQIMDLSLWNLEENTLPSLAPSAPGVSLDYYGFGQPYSEGGTTYSWDKAVDGDVSTYAWLESGTAKDAYFTVDLGTVKEIKDIQIVRQNKNGFGDSFAATVKAGLTPSSLTEVGKIEANQFGVNLVLDTPVFGRYISLQDIDATAWCCLADFSINKVKVTNSGMTEEGSGTGVVGINHLNLLSNMCDGDDTTFEWFVKNVEGSTLTLDLGTQKDISKISLHMAGNGNTTDYIRDVTLQYSIDGTEYTDIQNYKDTPDIDCTLDNSIKARYIRAKSNITDGYGVQIREFSAE